MLHPRGDHAAQAACDVVTIDGAHRGSANF
jgi:hypothetical protein